MEEEAQYVDEIEKHPYCLRHTMDLWFPLESEEKERDAWQRLLNVLVDLQGAMKTGSVIHSMSE